MIRIAGRGAVYGEVWYDEEPQRDCGVDIVLYRQREAPVARAKVVPFLSMVTDLSAANEEITGRFGKDCRYKTVPRLGSPDLVTAILAEPAGDLLVGGG